MTGVTRSATGFMFFSMSKPLRRSVDWAMISPAKKAPRIAWTSMCSNTPASPSAKNIGNFTGLVSVDSGMIAPM